MIRGIYKDNTFLSKLFIFIGLFLTGFGLATVLGLLSIQFFFGLDVLHNSSLLSDYSNPQVIDALKFLQFLNSVGIFIFPPLAFAYLASMNLKKFFLLDRAPNVLSAGLAIIIMVSALPLINFLVDFNGAMQFPEALRGIEEWMRSKEDSAESITKSFLIMDNGLAYFYNLILIGIIPAFGEELLFRGLIQKQLIKKTGNYHLAIWITAFLFSAMHLQFYGFLPRFLLGGMFGYLFVWSGNLWLPIIAHLLNNAGAVSLQYFFGKDFTSENIDTFGTQPGDWIFLLMSCLILLWLLYFFKKNHSVST